MLVNNGVVDDVLECIDVVDNLLLKDAAALVSATATLGTDGEWNCPYHKEMRAHKKWPLSNYEPSTPIGGDCNDSKSLLDTTPLS